ncbi:(2Fe-2S)-binding protein [Pseudonocardia asaccharolytica DSM 44247 = NBRC 16224]|uniref:(2Fe-2S)-binding protein n=1 Tax=Pseudonocardia asaccharolytica DSM 44247 = NBRC 16224 TaxID=1123024 RepID=A0A511D5M4_9PSEU|nr:(2Fe-2S)-binding protein [Pseudonocardia asaccharolytica DSM 44247 = NBRC 16224]
MCHKDDLGPGQMTGAQLGPIRVVVIRAKDGSLHALAAKCLHQGGPLDQGRLYDHTLTTDDVGRYAMDADREIIKCPWHGYEYDIRTGATVFDETRCLQTFATREEGDQITVELEPPGAAAASA